MWKSYILKLVNAIEIFMGRKIKGKSITNI